MSPFNHPTNKQRMTGNNHPNRTNPVLRGRATVEEIKAAWQAFGLTQVVCSRMLTRVPMSLLLCLTMHAFAASPSPQNAAYRKGATQARLDDIVKQGPPTAPTMRKLHDFAVANDSELVARLDNYLRTKRATGKAFRDETTRGYADQVASRASQAACFKRCQGGASLAQCGESCLMENPEWVRMAPCLDKSLMDSYR